MKTHSEHSPSGVRCICRRVTGAFDGLQRLEDFVADSEVNVKLHQRSAIETRIDQAPGTRVCSR
jgi:hypothetical protein